MVWVCLFGGRGNREELPYRGLQLAPSICHPLSCWCGILTASIQNGIIKKKIAISRTSTQSITPHLFVSLPTPVQLCVLEAAGIKNNMWTECKVVRKFHRHCWSEVKLNWIRSMKYFLHKMLSILWKETMSITFESCWCLDSLWWTSDRLAL